MRSLLWLIAPVVVVALLVIQLVRPVPDIQMQVQMPATFTVQAAPPSIPWPSAGQSALAISGVGLVGSSGAKSPQPIASLAKMMVAYLVLHDHPLSLGQNGPQITITPADVALYQSDNASHQSVLPVAAGEVLTERQMLEGLLLPSGNNVATMLARWDGGSLSAFVDKMNATAKSLGMTNTHYADASGYDPSTQSTALDQITLAEAAMNISTFADIVKMPQATLPVAGIVYNVNGFLGRSGIIGIKTGSTTDAGGCYVVAADATVNGKSQLVIAAVLGQGGVQMLHDALVAGQNLIVAGQKLATTATPVRAGEVAATLTAPWGKSAQLTVPSAPTFVAWGGMKGTTQVTPVGKLGRTVQAGAQVATLTITLGTQKAVLPLKAPAAIPGPKLTWRLTRR